jgi:hypothetical protein
MKDSLCCTLQQVRVNVNPVGNNTILEYGHGELAEYLISLGMDVNSPSKEKLTPVHYCGIHRQLDLCTSFELILLFIVDSEEIPTERRHHNISR